MPRVPYEAPRPNVIAFVLKGYPRLSETFIANEIAALETRGLDLVLYSLRRPTETARHPVHTRIRARVHYLPEYLREAPRALARAWWALRHRPGYRPARRAWLRDLVRDPTSHRVRRFGQALILAHTIAPGVRHLHAHFVHSPASVTRYAALLTGLPWSVSAHAKDIWITPEWDKREKLAACAWLVTCTEHGRAHLAGLAPPGRVALVHHGLDARRIAPATQRPHSARLTFLSVGRLVEKKGYDVLLAAFARLPADLDWRFVHVGGGPLRRRLARRAARLGIDARILWRGPLAEAEVFAAYRSADIFVLASRIARDGDRDGIPNVLMEAQSQGLAVIASAVAAIPELVVDGENGVLVPPEDPVALAAALLALARDPDRRARLAAAAQARLSTHFDADRGIDDLCRRFACARP